MDLKDKFVQEPRDFPCHLNKVNFPKVYPTQNIICDQVMFLSRTLFEKIKLTII